MTTTERTEPSTQGATKSKGQSRNTGKTAAEDAAQQPAAVLGADEESAPEESKSVEADGALPLPSARGDSLARRICTVMAALSRIPKAGRNVHHGYDYIESAAVTAAVRPALAQAGVMILPQVLDVTPMGKNLLVHMSYTLINADDPTDQLVINWLAEGQDTQDKAINKATTVSQKYMLMRLFCLSDKDDPDAEGPDASAGEGRVWGAPTVGSGTPPPTARPTQPQAATQATPSTESFSQRAGNALASRGESTPAKGAEMGATARAFLAEINSSTTKAELGDSKSGLVARIRNATTALSDAERTALFNAINQQMQRCSS